MTSQIQLPLCRDRSLAAYAAQSGLFDESQHPKHVRDCQLRQFFEVPLIIIEGGSKMKMAVQLQAFIFQS
jgi:hypothetical protein